ncbi:MAG: dienelactone hydrolase family protein [Conexibacter sp.]|nr:dienelactone hydrolase family protein [Conexibacter sp.]
MPDLTFVAASGTLGAYVARPEGDGPWPGVVVIQDALGMGDDLRAQADRLAAGGYLAFAPDLYSGRGLRCVVATIASSRSGKGPAYRDIEAARQWLAGQEDCTGRIGIIGFCMGGGFALLSAPQLDFAAAAVNYGEVPKETARLAGACPVVGSYGKRDRAMGGRAARLETALTELGVRHDVKEYPDAGHSFMNKIGGPRRQRLLHVAGAAYHGPSAQDAWARILAFFDAELREA